MQLPTRLVRPRSLGFEFEVLMADPRQVKRLKIKRVTRPVRGRKRDGTPPAGTPDGEQKSAAE